MAEKPPKKEEKIFYEALEKSPEQREAFLKETCGKDQQLYNRVEALLKAHDVDDSFLENSPMDSEVTVDTAPVREVCGSVIGRYKLLEQIGEGGMAVVFMAEQTQPFQRRVALKIIKLGMDTKQVIARFEVERQALALMDHPNIAKVHDAGTTETGRPYFVMELVRGISITKYCDQHKLNALERLELFKPVCEAVHHAHQKGIIHRDIKPSNVLVTLHDGKPVPKVIDFGIAKAVSRKLTEKTVFTHFAQLIGTPEYMSPEQAEMSGLDIDTRTDIYSLGILLYELLTGTLPFDPETLRSAAFGEIQRIIREEEPPTPSKRLSGLGEEAKNIAESRRTDVTSLVRSLHRELEWIPLMAMRKDRTHRYRSASELADDIQNYLDGAPLIAGPESAVYRTRKFIRRNRTSVTAAALVILVFVVGFIISMYMYFEAEDSRRREAVAYAEAKQQADISKAVNEFLNDDLLASVDPRMAKGREITVREVLDAASEKIEGKFEGKPLIEASIRQTLGGTYWNLGKYEEAELHWERSYRLRREHRGEEHKETLASMNNVGMLYERQGRYDEAEPLLVKSLDVKRRVLGEEHRETLVSMNNVGLLYENQGRYDEAEPILVKALEVGRRVLGEEHPDTLTCMNNLGGLYQSQGRFDEAEPLLVKSLDIQRRILGEEHPSTLISINNLANFYRIQRRYDEAEPILVKALEVGRRVLGEEHPVMLIIMNNLALMYKNQGLYNKAKPLYVKVIEVRRRVLGEEHPGTLAAELCLALTYMDDGQYDEAEPLYFKRLELKRRVLGEEHPDTLTSMQNLGVIYRNQGRYKEAEQFFVKVLEVKRQVLGEKHPSTIQTAQSLVLLTRRIRSLGRKQYESGEYEDAVKTLKRVDRINHTILGNESSVSDLAYIVMVLHQLARKREAETTVSRLRGLFENVVRRQGESYFREAEKLIAGKDSKVYLVWELIEADKLDEASKIIGELRASSLQMETEFSRPVDSVIKGLARAYYTRAVDAKGCGDYGKVTADFEAAGHFYPSNALIFNDLAWFLATCPNKEFRKGTKAIENATKACELTNWKNTTYVSTLAAAHAEVGDFESAAKQQMQAINLLSRDEQPVLQPGYEIRLELYKSGRPYHTGMIGWWKFDGNSNDSSGCQHDGIEANEPTYVPGIRGQALSLTGKGDHILIPDIGTYLNGLDALTICLWIKANTIGTDQGFVIFEDPNNYDNMGMRFDAAGVYGKGVNLIKCAVSTNAKEGPPDFPGRQQLESSSNVQTTNWQHIAMTWNKGSWLKLYINGQKDKPTWIESPNSGFLAGYEKMIIGKGGKEIDNTSWDGFIDDVRIYSYALSEKQIREVMAGNELGSVQKSLSEEGSDTE